MPLFAVLFSVGGSQLRDRTRDPLASLATNRAAETAT